MRLPFGHPSPYEMSYTAPDPVKKITANPVKSGEDLIDLLHDLLIPLQAGQSPGGARIRIGHTGTHFDQVAAELEGYARALWGLAPMLAADPENPKFSGLREAWVRGLDNGTNPAHEEYWGDHTDNDQRFVEMAAIGFSLSIAPDVFWKPQSVEAKKRISHWLLEANKFDFPTNNWRFFRVLINLGLRLVGAEYSQQAIDDELDFIESYYGPHGFPSDGPSNTCKAYDYYATSFAIPFYSLIYARLAGSFDPERAERYRRRAIQNIPEVVHLFAPDGAAIPFGRSMTYRFACSAFWGALAYDDIELPAPFTWGVVKGLLLRNIRWFTQKESVFSADGTLTIGWAYPNLFMSEDYNSPQSPYWALKAFLPLILPSSHPFWQAKEEPYPSQLQKESYHISRPWMQVFSHAAGHTFVLSAGQSVAFPMRQAAAKYGKFAYSSQFGFSVPTGALNFQQHAPDSVLALSDDGEGERWVVPRKVEHRGISDKGIISSVWKPWPDVMVETYVIPPPTSSSPFHTRVHKITSSRAILAADSGFAIHSQAGPIGSERRMPVLQAPSEDVHGRFENKQSGIATSRAGVSGVFDLLRTGRGRVHNADGNSNTNFARTVIPSIVSQVQGEKWLATRVFAIPADSISKGWLKEWEASQKGWESIDEMKKELGI